LGPFTPDATFPLIRLPPQWNNLPKAPFLDQFEVRGALFPKDAEALNLFSGTFEADADRKIDACIGSSSAPSTLKNYYYAYRLWAHACRDKGWIPCPADPVVFARYLVQLASNRQNVGCVSRAIEAVNYVHIINGLVGPGRTLLPIAVLTAVERDLKAPLRQAAPLTPWMLKSIILQYCTPTSPIKHWVVGVGITLGYMCFGRYDCLKELRLEASDCQFYLDGPLVRIFVAKRKTETNVGRASGSMWRPLPARPPAQSGSCCPTSSAWPPTVSSFER
jgi:hypothetical protein